jgi:predicted CoA-binding protein
VKVVIIGASDNPERYSYKAAEALLKKGYDIELIGVKNKTLFNIPIERSINCHLSEMIITLYVGPQHQSNYIDDIIKARPLKVIFNPGTENSAFQELLTQHQIDWEEACTLVKLSLNQFP